MRQRMITLILLGLSVFLLLTAIVVAVWRFGGERAEWSGGRSSAAETASEVLPAEEPAEELSYPEQALRERTSPVLTEQPVTVGSEYFADAAFVVNSVSRGLDLYDYETLLVQADFYGGADLSLYDAGECLQEMSGREYGKIYLGLGIAELGDDIEDIRSGYETLLAELRTVAPESIIVLMSVPPVSEYRSSTDEYCNRELVVEYNEMLRVLADAWDVWYLDVYSVLANADGYLPSEVNEDGIHFTPAHYTAWFERLCTHYVNDGTVSLPTPERAPEEAPEAENVPEHESGED